MFLKQKNIWNIPVLRSSNREHAACLETYSFKIEQKVSGRTIKKQGKKKRNEGIRYRK